MTIKLRTATVFTLILAMFLPAAANDTMVTLGAGGLIPTKTTGIVMESEDLEVSTNSITVKYVFHNTTNHDVDATVAFPLPALDGGTVENSPISIPSKDPVNYMSFKVAVDGRAVSPEVEVRAFKNGKNITARLNSLGLPLSVLDAKLGSAIRGLTTEQRRLLEKDTLIVGEEIQRAGSSKPEQHLWAWWETRVQFYWMQHFPANGTVQIEHEYQPIVGGSYLVRSDDGDFAVKPYCGSSESLAKIREVKSRITKKDEIDVVLLERRIQYILTTGNNWSGPIRHFHLTITKDSPEDILVTCMAGLKAVSSTNYELTRTDFRPDKELNLLILQPNK
jgi:Domain of unknown function (DUF4424)